MLAWKVEAPGTAGDLETNDEEIVYSPVVSGFHAVHVLVYGDAGSTPSNTYTLSISP